ncbi:hypothetical protein GCM10022233_37680 [Streptomyces shaanxiensis]|uniref:Uncharacterized protein n=1 Tax=Streptomyces shaanxiensis TaxID=653357 RepID=A0ABP7V6T0_9ACTN
MALAPAPAAARPQRTPSVTPPAGTPFIGIRQTPARAARYRTDMQRHPLRSHEEEFCVIAL